MFKKNLKRIWKIAVLALVSSVVFISCASEDDSSSSSSSSSTVSSTSVSTPTVNISMPDSLTGGSSSSSSSSTLGKSTAQAEDSGPNCNFDGHGSGNPFSNGYGMTKFLAGMVAGQMCLADFLMSQVMAMGFTVDGSFNTISDENDPGSPTGISITPDSSTQYTIRVYWANSTDSPSMFISWNTANDVTSGKLVMNSGARGDAEASDGGPTDIRLDFSQSSTQQQADLYMKFPTSNSFQNGFRIQLTKDLSDNTYTILGIMDMKAQFGASSDSSMSTYVTELPVIKMYSIADSDGKGAAVATMADMAFPFDMGSLGNFGYYLFTKTDKYFFTSAGASEYVNKSITSATYKTGSSSATAGQVTTLEGFGATDLSGCIGGSDSSCLTFMSALFSSSTFGQEANSGSDPGDSRSTTINNLTDSSYLSSVYPTGSTSFDGVFDMSFTP